MPALPAATAPGSAGAAAPQPGTTRRAPIVSWLPLGALTLLAALLRFPTLGRQSLWFDEAATWDAARLPFGEMLGALPDRESNPPLFYVLEWASVRLFGEGEVALRLLSAVAGTLLIPVAYALGRWIGGRRTGLATAAIVAVNPLLVWFSQEARSYALVTLLAGAALLCFVRALDDDRARPLALWALLSAAALATHYFALFAIVPQAAWLLLRHPRRRAALAACGAVAATLLALLPLLLAQSSNPYDIAGISLPTRLVQLPKQFALGYRGPLPLATGLLGLALVLCALWRLRSAERALRGRALAVGAVGVATLLVPLLAAAVGLDYVNARNLLPGLLPLAAVLAAGFAAPAPAARLPARAGVALLVAYCAISCAIVVTVTADRQFHRADWRGLAAALGSSPHPRAIVTSPANGPLVLRYYGRELEPMSYDGVEVREIDVVGLAGSTSPGGDAELPRLHLDRTQLAVEGFAGPERRASDSWVVLRYTAPRPIFVVPDPLAAVRFTADFPSISVLRAGG